MLLTEQQIRDLTGYRQHARQARWIAEQLKLKVPIRADGLPVLTQAQIAALQAQVQELTLQALSDNGQAIEREAAWRKALEAVRDKLIRAGARLPVDNKGTIESALETGLSIALMVVETETAAAFAAQEQPGSASSAAGEAP